MRHSNGLLTAAHASVILLSTCGTGVYLDRLMGTSHGSDHNIFFSSSALVVFQSSLTTLFLSFLGMLIYSLRRAWKKNKRIRFTLEARYPWRSYGVVALLSSVCMGSWVESAKLVGAGSRAISMAILPVLLVVLLVLVGTHRPHSSLYLSFLPLLTSLSLYLILLPRPHNDFEREDAALGTAILICRLILLPLLIHFYATEFPSPRSQIAEGTTLDLVTYSLLNRRLTPLLDVTFFSSIISAILALLIIYLSIAVGGAPTSLAILSEYSITTAAFSRLCLCLSIQFVALISLIGVAGPFTVAVVWVLCELASHFQASFWSNRTYTATHRAYSVVFISMVMVFRRKERLIDIGEEEASEESDGSEEQDRSEKMEPPRWKEASNTPGCSKELVLNVLGISFILLPLFLVRPTPLPPALTTLFQSLNTTPISCGPIPAPQRWDGSTRTILASNPRSGNTYLRELVESSFGWETSTESYCDLVLGAALKGECDHEANFLVKSHYPSRLAEKDLDWPEQVKADRFVHLVRNPIDAIYSWYHFAHVPRTRHNQLSHSSRLRLNHPLGADPDELHDLKLRAQVWAHHEQYWHEKARSMPHLIVRYEDVSSATDARLNEVLRLRHFLLPDEDLYSLSVFGKMAFDPLNIPSSDLQRIGCAVADSLSGKGSTGSSAAYDSAKKETFSSWKSWSAEARKEVLEIVRVGWCRHGYEAMLRESGKMGGVGTGLCN